MRVPNVKHMGKEVGSALHRHCRRSMDARHRNHFLEGADLATAIKLLRIAGSLRKASTNRGLLRAARANLPTDVRLDIAN